MEIRLNAHGRNSLATKVFFSDESGFEVASVIVTGKTDAVLIRFILLMRIPTITLDSAPSQRLSLKLGL